LKGKLQKGKERLLSLKIKQENYKSVEGLIIKHNSYEVPQVIATEVVRGSIKYLEWIDESSL
jgi:periplasmic divalent cation tolerance protein